MKAHLLTVQRDQDTMVFDDELTEEVLEGLEELAEQLAEEKATRFKWTVQRS